MNVESKCPMDGGKVDGAAVLFDMTNRLWWPNQLDISVPPTRTRPPATRWAPISIMLRNSRSSISPP